jgi:hypothetical protein
MPPSATQEEPLSNGHATSAQGHKKTVQKARTYEKTKKALTLERKYAAGNYHPLGVVFDRELDEILGSQCVI